MDPHLTSPFRIFGTVSLTVGQTSARVALSRAREQTCMVAYSADPATDPPIFIAFGDSTVVATTSDFPILPNTYRAFTLTADQTNIAAIVGVAGSPVIYASVGEGV